MKNPPPLKALNAAILFAAVERTMTARGIRTSRTVAEQTGLDESFMSRLRKLAHTSPDGIIIGKRAGISVVAYLTLIAWINPDTECPAWVVSDPRA